MCCILIAPMAGCAAPELPDLCAYGLPGMGAFLLGERPCTRIQTGSRAVAAVVAVVVAQVKRYGMVG